MVCVLVYEWDVYGVCGVYGCVCLGCVQCVYVCVGVYGMCVVCIVSFENHTALLWGLHWICPQWTKVEQLDGCRSSHQVMALK